MESREISSDFGPFQAVRTCSEQAEDAPGSNHSNKDTHQRYCIKVNSTEQLDGSPAESGASTSIYGSSEALLNDESNHCCRKFLRCERICLCILVLIMWAVLSVPVILYHIPVQGPTPNANQEPEMFDNTTFVQEPPSNLVCTVSCNEDFFCKEGRNQCVPNCGSFKQWPPSVHLLINVITITLSTIGITANVVVLVIACLQWKRILKFPSIFVVYQCITSMILIPFILTAFVDQEGLFCSSQDLTESLQTATPFCVLIGTVLLYAPLQLSLWWLFHISVSFWKIQFPFYYRNLELARRTKYVHVGCVLLGLAIPLTPPIVTMVHGVISTQTSVTDGLEGNIANATVATVNTLIGRLGFRISTFPPSECAALNEAISYYSLVLPLYVVLMIGSPLLLILFWKIYKQQGIFRHRFQGLKNSTMMNSTNRKLLIILIYYVTTGFVNISAFSSATRTQGRFSNELTLYFLCEGSGHDPSNPCDRSGFEQLMIPTTALMTTGVGLLTLFPLVNLVYIVNFKDLRKSFTSLFISWSKYF